MGRTSSYLRVLITCPEDWDEIKSTYEPSSLSGWGLIEEWRKWEYFYFLLDLKLVHCRVTTQHWINHYPFIPVGREVLLVKVKCLSKEHNTISLPKAQTKAQVRVEHFNHEVTVPPSTQDRTEHWWFSPRRLLSILEEFASILISHTEKLKLDLCLEVKVNTD